MTKSKAPATIGRVTIVDFPKLGALGIPAKVDTGADASSIWASNIKERAGKLSFTLFGIGSPYYTGEVITTKYYHIRSIKNSFGHAEFRYKVNLQVALEGRVINVSFSLANRADNRFPVLIGRRTLHGRFLIDVSRDDKKKYEVLVVRSNSIKSTKVSAKFFRHLQQENRKLNFTFVNLNDLEFLIGDGNSKIRITKTGKDIADFDMVAFRVILANVNVGAAVAQYLQYRNVPFIDRSLLYNNQSVNKLQQLLVLDNMGVKVPQSYFVTTDQLPGSYKAISAQLGLPFVLKDIRGKRGRNLFLVSDKSSFLKAVKAAQEKSLDLVAQKFIAHDGHYRLMVLGKKIELVIFMMHKFSEPRLTKKVSAGKSMLVDEHKLPGAVREMSITAASVSNIEIAGVDVLQDKNSGLWYCLEVNENPQLVTGSFIKEKEQVFAEYLLKKMGR